MANGENQASAGFGQPRLHQNRANKATGYHFAPAWYVYIYWTTARHFQSQLSQLLSFCIPISIFHVGFVLIDHARSLRFLQGPPLLPQLLTCIIIPPAHSKLPDTAPPHSRVEPTPLAPSLLTLPLRIAFHACTNHHRTPCVIGTVRPRVVECFLLLSILPAECTVMRKGR